MAKPFDATLNWLIDARLADWVAFLAPRLGLNPGPADLLDTDLSTTVQADKVFRHRSLSMTLEDSTTYQEILKKGEVKGEARG